MLKNSTVFATGASGKLGRSAGFHDEAGRKFHLGPMQEGPGDGGLHCTGIFTALHIPITGLRDVSAPWGHLF